MTDYRDYAKDLRELADVLESNALDLPLPRYDNVPLTIDIHVAEQDEPVYAAAALGVTPKISVTGHTTATVRIGTVELKFVHITDTAMAAHHARMARADATPAAVTS